MEAIPIITPLDVATPFSFDHAYYGNLEAKMGLYLDLRTKPLAQALARDKQKFFQAFSAVMDKMGSIAVTGGWIVFQL
ncbi:hypothetical protein RJ641_002268 [Dillenia turbinata]|uniref:Peroxidase n=1 Tax=Dillenia turbinata TaxID=194707 RepID=A0AAN8VJ81_9MAGN